MATVSLSRENYVLHKLHSLTGIIPVGFYMVQHLVLNSFSLAGPDKFNAVIGFFDGIPPYVLLAVEIFVIWIPLAFHSVYGLFITFRGKPNYIGTKYGWSQNRMYSLQRVSGIVIFFFLCVHYGTTTGYKYATHSSANLMYNAWYEKLTGSYHLWLVFYLIGILASAYHLAYGIWNFSIRWGIAISDRAQVRVQQISFWSFIALTILGWAALGGFLLHPPSQTAMTSTPTHIVQASFTR